MTEKPESSGSSTGVESLRPRCRVCGHEYCESMGAIPASDMFAGRIRPSPAPGGWLWRCPGCDSLFRHPVPAEEDYLSLYESVDCGVWQAGALRKDQKLVHAAVTRYIGGGRILDVGCFTGQLLCGFDASYEKFGVEPAVTAAESAKKKGIHVLGATLNDVPDEMRFDCILSIDVVEHLLDPARFFRRALDLLNPRGLLVISTGNPGSFAWRYVFKSRFWYVTNAEHVSFPSKKFIDGIAREMSSSVVETTNFRYDDPGLLRRSVKFAGQVVYAVSPRLYNLIRGRGGDGSRFPSIYSLGVFSDHHLIAVQRP